MRTKKLRGYKRKLRQSYRQGYAHGLNGKTQEYVNPYNTDNEYPFRESFYRGQKRAVDLMAWLDNGCQ